MSILQVRIRRLGLGATLDSLRTPCWAEVQPTQDIIKDLINMYRYYAFMLPIQSELMFPELKELPLDLNTSDQLTIKFGEVNPQGLQAPNSQKKLFFQATESEFWLHIPNIARFLVTHGNQIIIDPYPGVDEDSIRVFLLGSCMGALLMQRNLYLLHGNAVKINGHCVSFVGNSGVGKSTLSGAFFKRGYSILADDVCAINERGQVMPSFPQIKLWLDAASHLEIDMQPLRKIRPCIEKFAVPLAHQFHSEPLPLKVVYVLNTTNQENFQFTSLAGLQKLQPLRNNVYRKSYLKGLAKEQSYFMQCARIAGHVSVVRVTRPQIGFKLNELVDLIEQDLIERGVAHA